jgi:ABC-type lipoprotein release transport system permease subunit
MALDEAQGTTDFASLFLSMSLFLVIAAAGLAGTLTRLAAERRAAQAGLMMATGFTSAAASRVVLAEGMLLALAGTIIGAPLGILYAWGIVHGMDRWWIQSLGTSVLWLHLSLSSLITGAVSGLIIGALTVGWATRVYRRYRVLDLLAGWQSLATLPSGRSTRAAGVMALALLVIAVGLAVAAATTGAVPPGEACFMSGAALLGASLAGCYALLAGLWQAASRSLTMPGLAIRSAAANRGRSMLVVGLLASSCFIMVAVSANTRDFSHFDTRLKDSGTGGFTLRATSSMPIRFDFGAPAGRSALGFRPSDEPIFQRMQVFPFLASTGEDISCLNLARPTAPRVLGVSPAMIQRGGFTVLTESGAPANPWQLLNGGPARDGAIPAMGDADSITWTLHSALGEVYPTPTGAGKMARLRFVGMLSRSIIAGELLISEANFRVAFPEVASPRYFLIVTPPGKAAAVASALRRNLGDMGLQVQTTREVLNTYGAVQNTYISMFLALGGLGLLMGTIGMVAVILRNALDRRREWALMLATGFTRQDLARLLIMENAALLAIGIVCGTLSALVAVAPQLTLVESHVSWPGVVGLLAGTALVGLISCIASARTAVAGPLVQALQEEA